MADLLKVMERECLHSEHAAQCFLDAKRRDNKRAKLKPGEPCDPRLLEPCNAPVRMSRFALDLRQMALPRPVEQITWRDCVSLGGWQYLADMQEWAGRVITTVGMVVEETEDDLVLAMSSGDASAGEVLCNWMSIPKSSIRERIVLRSNVELTGAARLHRAASSD